MNAGYTIAVCAIPFLERLAGEEAKVASTIAQSAEGGSEAIEQAISSARQQLIQGVDDAVRALPGPVRGEPGLAKAFAYGLVGLADERMLHQPTGTVEQWRDALLEADLYDTAIAGQEIIRRARAAALAAGAGVGEEEERAEEGTRIFGPFYLALLRAGFEGALRGDARALAALTESLEEAAACTHRAEPMRIAAPPKSARPSRSPMSPRSLALIACIAWLAEGPVLWSVLSGATLAETQEAAERLRASLPPRERAHQARGIGPTRAGAHAGPQGGAPTP